MAVMVEAEVEAVVVKMKKGQVQHIHQRLRGQVGRDYLVYSLPSKLGDRHSSPNRSEVRGEGSVGREQGEGRGSWQWATSIGSGGVPFLHATQCSHEPFFCFSKA